MTMTWKTRYNASPNVCYSTKLKLPNCVFQKIAFFSLSYDYNQAWNPIRLITLLAKALNEKNRKRWPEVPQRMIFLIKNVPSSRKANKKLEKRGAATFSFIFLLEADLFFPLLVLMFGLNMKMKADY